MISLLKNKSLKLDLQNIGYALGQALARLMDELNAACRSSGADGHLCEAHGPDLHPRLIWHGHGQWRNDGRAASSAR